MSVREIHACQCSPCQQPVAHPDQVFHEQINLLMSRLDEQQRRWLAAVESHRVGRGGDALLSLITGLNEKTIARGREELVGSLEERPSDRIRLPGAGRPSVEKNSMIGEALDAAVEPQTAGSPTDTTKWTRCSLRFLSRILTESGHQVGRTTVGRLLRERDYSLLGHRKEKETNAAHPERNRQFLYLRTQVEVFRQLGRPVISVDTKKKELIGEFRNVGASWGREPVKVNVHDFLQDALGKAVPYGIYDLSRSRGPSSWETRRIHRSLPCRPSFDGGKRKDERPIREKSAY